MRKLIFLFLLCITCMLQAQNAIDNPRFKFRSGSIYNITRIERTPGCNEVAYPCYFPSALVGKDR